MGTQRETTHVARPFKDFLVHKGWYVENVHGNAYSSLPFDCIALHPQYEIRLIEFKVAEHMSLSRNQKVKLPIWILNNAKIWFIVADDLRGNYAECCKLYKKLFKPANAAYYLTAEDRRFRI